MLTRGAFSRTTGGEIQYPDFSSFQNIGSDPSAFSPTVPTTTAGHFPLATQLSSPTSPLSPNATSSHQHDKHDIDFMSQDPLSAGLDGPARIAAEEDKRRRNTAASARFRVKKKLREQALEKSAKEMTEKMDRLENRIQQLELENKWLKSLITEKNEVTSTDAVASARKGSERAVKA
jgi:hypothetical protein